MTKEVFYAGFQDDTKLADVINDEGWKWPMQWLVKFPQLNNIPIPVLNDSPDKPVWVDKKGSTMKFTMSSVWKDVREEIDQVCWKNLVWHSHSIPKHTYILWLAVRKKLCTQDKLQRWYPNKTYECSLCEKGVDSHDHLFFKCEFAIRIWKSICKIAKIKSSDNTWERIVNKLSIETTGGGVWEIIKKLCLAATVYYIWQKRNYILFTGQKRSADDLFKTVCEEIKAKMVSIRVKQTTNVLNAETIWNIKFDRKA